MQQATTKSTTEDKGCKSVNVQVVVRVRPLNSKETEAKDTTAISCSPQTKDITFSHPKATGSKTYTFDTVYGPHSSQAEVFEQTVRPIVDEVLKGFNCTLFAYGQTGTGKTYTMEGRPDSETHAGVIPRAIHHIFDSLEKSSSEVRVSHLELYNEELRDLLSNENKQLRIYDGLMDAAGKRGCTVNNLEEVIVSNAQSIFSIMENSTKRQTAETLLSPNSSRSHCIFTVTIHTKEATPDGEDLLKVGKLNLVDLAGSENISKSGTGGEGRKREAGMINTSLLTLGRVITAITEHSTYVPYRESKLTRLLQDSLGGKTKTCMIATVSPSVSCVEETQSTLDYAHRAKNIRTRPEVNQKMTKKALIKEYVAEIENLKILLRSARDKNGVYVPTETFESMETELQMRRNQVGDVEQILEKREAELEVLKASVNEKVVEIEVKDKLIQLSKEELEKTSQQLEETTQQYTVTKDTLVHTQNTLSSHKEYEQVLRTNLDASLSDREQLFSKIDRKKVVESTNKNKVDHARGVLLERVEALERVLSVSSSHQSEFYTTIESSIGSFLKRKDEQIQALVTQMGAMSIMINNATQTLDSLSREMQAKSAESVQSLTTTAQQHSTAWLSDASQFYQESMKTVATMRELVTEQSTEMKMWATNQVDSILNHHKVTSAFLAQQSAALERLSEQASEASTQQQSRAKEHQNDLKMFAESQVSSMQAWQAEFMAQIGNVLQKSVDRRTQMLRDEASTLALKFDTDLNNISESNGALTASVGAAISDIRQFNTNSELFYNQASDDTTKFLDTSSRRVGQYNGESHRLATCSDELIKRYRDSLQLQSQNTSTKSQEMLDSFATLNATHNELVDTTRTGVDSLLSQFSAEVTSLQDITNQHGAVLSEKISTAAINDKSAHSSLHTGVDNIRKNVSSLFALKEDLPTGVTPIKKPIPVPLLEQFTAKHSPQLPPKMPPAVMTPTHANSDIPLLPVPFNALDMEDAKPKKPCPTSSIITPTPIIQASTNVNTTAIPKQTKIPKLQDKRFVKAANKENLVNAR